MAINPFASNQVFTQQSMAAKPQVQTLNQSKCSSSGGLGANSLTSSLADLSIKGMFRGHKYNGSADHMSEDPLMQQVANFMDQNPDKYGKPHAAKGNIRTWHQELAEDDKVSGEEKGKFQQGLRDFLASSMGSSNAMGGAGNAMCGPGNAMGNNPNAINGNALGQFVNNLLNASVSPGLNGSGQIDPMMEMVMGMLSRLMDTNNSQFGQPSSQNAMNNLMNNILNPMGTGGMGNSGMNNAGMGNSSMTPETSDAVADSAIKGMFDGRHYNGNSEHMADDPLMQKVAEFMDNNPQMFDKPDSAKGWNVNTWKQELAENDTVSDAEKDQFKKGLKEMMKASFGTASGLGSNTGVNAGQGLNNPGLNQGNCANPISGNALGQALTLLVGAAAKNIASNAINSALNQSASMINNPMGTAGNALGGVGNSMNTALKTLGPALEIAQTAAKFMDSNQSRFGTPMNINVTVH